MSAFDIVINPADTERVMIPVDFFDNYGNFIATIKLAEIPQASEDSWIVLNGDMYSIYQKFYRAGQNVAIHLGNRCTMPFWLSAHDRAL